MSKYCPDCGFQNEDEDLYCEECGKKIKNGDYQTFDILDNRYEIHEEIKSGGMGSVFKAFDTRLDEFVAVKKMLYSYQDPQDKLKAEEMFKREAKILTKLHHGGLPKVTDFFTMQDQKGALSHYLVMTYIDGDDLETILKRKTLPLSLEEALDYFHQLIGILSYLHSQTPPVLYRDLKPSNIMMKGSSLFLVDFGIAKVLETGRKGTMIGTPGYASPDQCKGHDIPENDIYSLGALMHYLFTGCNPEDPSRPTFLFEPLASLNRSVPDYLCSLVDLMLNLVGQKRPDAKRVKEVLEGKGGAVVSSVKPLAKPKPQKPFTDYDSFFDAVKRNDVAKVEEYINHGADINAKDNDGVTPLHWAAHNGHTATAELLIQKGADVNAKDNMTFTPLHLAAMNGHTATAELLIQKGANVNAKNKRGETPLHIAAFWGHTATAKLLIQKGANVNAKDKNGFTPLHWAVYNGHTATAELLIQNGADINMKEDKNDFTPLHSAAYKGYTAIAEFLIQKGANVNAKNKRGETPLHIAAFWGHTATAKLLIQKGANVNAKDKNGFTPLHFAAIKGHTATAKLLIQKRADVNAKMNNGWTPLHLATMYGHNSTAELLIKKDADVNAKDNDSRNPLDIAKQRGFIKIENLLKKKLSPSKPKAQKPFTDYNSFFDAVKRNDIAKVEEYINHGADVNAKDDDGDTPLHRAAREGHTATAELLIQNGADVNAKENDGVTPLHIAAFWGHTATAELLIQKGADVNVKNKGGFTPLYWAERFGHTTTVNLLRRHGAKE